MSGVYGFVGCSDKAGTADPASVARILERMSACLRLREWHQTQTWQQPGGSVGLGQANIGLFSAEVQPTQAEDGRLVAFFFGELYNAPQLRQDLQAKGFSFSSQSDCELVLRLYQDRGDELAKALEGVYTLAVWDGRRQRLLLSIDRYGLLPLYYLHHAGRLVFAPLVKAVLQVERFERRINLDGLADMLRFQRLLEDKTLVEQVYLLPYGSVLTYEAASDQLKVEHYWDFDQIPSWPQSATYNEAVEETGRLLRQSVERLTADGYKVGVYLSGGLDSRTILGFASRKKPVPPSLTYGYPDSKDVRYACQIARRLGSLHHFFPQLDGKWLKDHVGLHLAITEGHTTFIHAHSANTLEPSRALMQVNLSGFNGDQLVGGRAVDHAALSARARDDLAFMALFYQSLNRDFSWPGINEGEEKLLFTPAFYHQMRDRAFESLRSALSHFEKFPPPRRLDYFTAIYQGARLSNLNVVYQRAFIEARYPFYSYPLLDFVQSMPMEYRLGDRLYLDMVNREIPQVTWVPRDTDDLLLTNKKNLRALHALGQTARRRIDRYILRKPTLQTLHGDPEVWLRQDLSDWAASILFDPRTTARGIFEPAFVRSLYDRHMSNQEIWTIGKIAPLISFEMALRWLFEDLDKMPV